MNKLPWGIVALAQILYWLVWNTAQADDLHFQRLSVYQANYSPNRMLEILTLNNPDITGHSRVTALAYTRNYAGKPVDGLSWEIEVQLAQHSGRQSHQEVNGLISVRWNRFPWDGYINTSVAFGTGMSYAFEVPALEPRTRTAEEEDSSRLLNYLLFEVDLSPPQAPRWGLILRLHHRSGVNGLYNGVNGGSNFVGAGLRYAF